MSRSVVVHGFYGAGNLGDEAILTVLLADLANIGDIEPLVFSRRPREVQRLHGAASVNPARLGGLTGRWRLRQASAFVLGGGGLLKDYGETSANVRAWLRWLRRARAGGRRTAVWAVGVENLRFPESIELIRETLEDVDVVSVRDESSARRLREIGVSRPIGVSADPAVTLGAAYRRARSPDERPRIVVCLRHWFKYGPALHDERRNARLLDSVAATLDHAVTEWGAHLEFVPFRTVDYDDDRRVMHAVADRMRHGAVVSHRESAPRPAEAAELLASADLVVGMRLHSVILATAAGVPTLALSYMAKVRDYMSAIGQERFCVDVEDAGPERLREMLETLRRGSLDVSAQLIAATDSLCARYDSARAELAILLRRPDE